MEPLMQHVLEPLYHIMNKQQDPSARALRMITLMENTAITIGRIAWACPQVVGAHLHVYIKHWCLAMRNIRANEEKHQAFNGICRAIMTNPRGVMNDLIYFCDAINSWGPVEDTPAELMQIFHQILHSFKASANEAEAGKWEVYFQGFPEALRDPLRARFGL
jgi:transportin-1